MSGSGYESLLGRYGTIATTKTGTAYEILAAMVCKSLEENNVVIHDIKLRGRSGVKHQIDVSVETNDTNRSLLIECKDFSVGNRKVGLGVVRDFESAVADIRPDESWIVSCVGFTAPALKFAKAKGIKPVVMRLFEEADKDGRITNVMINIHIPTLRNVRADLCVSEADMHALSEAMKFAGIASGIGPHDDVFFEMHDGARIHFVDFVSRESSKINPDHRRATGQHVVKSNQCKLLIAGAEVSYDGVIIDYDIAWETETINIVASKIAELILSGIDDADIIVFDDQLKRRRIDPDTGRID